MLLKGLRFGLATLAGCTVVGIIIFGRELSSYVRTSARAVQTSAKQAVPMEFELQRARDLIDQIVPELRANIRIIAHNEVEVAHLKNEIEKAGQDLSDRQQAVTRLRDQIETRQVSYVVGDRTFNRQQMAERLSHQFEQYKRARAILVSKQRLLDTRERSLVAAKDLLEKTRNRKAELEQQIESLVAQHRLIKAQATASKVHVSGSQLARADRLLSQIKKRLDTAQRVLEHESDLLLEIPLEAEIHEDDLLAEIDSQLGQRAGAVAGLEGSFQ